MTDDRKKDKRLRAHSLVEITWVDDRGHRFTDAKLPQADRVAPLPAGANATRFSSTVARPANFFQTVGKPFARSYWEL